MQLTIRKERGYTVAGLMRKFGISKTDAQEALTGYHPEFFGCEDCDRIYDKDFMAVAVKRGASEKIICANCAPGARREGWQ